MTDFAAIPQELRERRQWVVWRLEQRDGKPTKVPYCAKGRNGHQPVNDARRASSTDPSTWSAFSSAVKAARNGLGYDGLGFVFSANDPYCGIDLDECFEERPLKGSNLPVVSLHPEATAIVSRLKSYQELSQSRRGLHVIIRADLNGFPRHRTNSTPWGGGFEVYDSERFFVMTGNSATGEIADRQAELEDVLREMFPPQPEQKSEPRTSALPVDVDDEKLLREMFTWKNGAEIERLWRGDWQARYPSQSEADCAWCAHLAFATRCDPELMDRMFRSSGLYRAKWDERRGDSTYGRREIDKAIAGCTETYSPATSVVSVVSVVPDDEEPESDLMSLRSLMSQRWPSPVGDAAYHGVGGEFVRLCDPHTEADPAAVLVQFLVATGSVIGRSGYFTAGAKHHYTNLNAAIVGQTAKGRKGTSFAPTTVVVGSVDDVWERERRQSGLSSGEGLIHAVRDPVLKTDDEGHETTIDEGERDKRLLVVEEELASVLKVMRREGNTLSTTIRQAFDDGRLRTMTRHTPMRATNAHVSIVGHITLEELRRELTETDAASGFANRFLWVLAKRSKMLPDGGEFHRVDVAPLIRQLQKVTTFARTVGEMGRDEKARDLWHAVYPELSADVPGLLGAVTARAEATTMRLALVYALLDCSPVVTEPHLQAALEVWRYCFESAAVIFGEKTGNGDADRIWEALLDRGELTRTDVRDLFGRHGKASRIDGAVALLVDMGRVELDVDDQTGGRPVQVLRPKRHKRQKGVE